MEKVIDEGFIQVGISMEPELRDTITALAKDEDRSWSSMARVLIREGLNERQKEKKKKSA